MITVQTFQEAQAIKDRIFIKRDAAGFHVYQKGDTVPAPKSAPVFKPLTANQFLKKLNDAGLRDQVEMLIANADRSIKDYFERTVEFRREHPLVYTVSQQLGLTSEMIDALWLQD